MTNIFKLDLSHTNLGGCASLWAPPLKKMKHLTELTFIGCNLIGEDMAHIAESVSDISTLIDIELSRNKTLCGCASLWATHLKRVKRLKKLTLRLCNLIGQNIAPIAESVGDMPTLTELDLSWNHTLGGCASWATHLKRMRHLKNLRLARCKLVGEDMAPIAQSVSDMPTLMELDLSGNHTLRGSASMWVIHLKGMKQLKNLRFTGYILTGEDMRLVNMAFKDNTTIDVEMDDMSVSPS
ncbi:leucine-rich repeat-containing protein 31-like [Asterias amurensis]|uniref:leucine-rich repeat-containing protein 31-like n=1 Tax=Asterias amurensis TaxID=7602 RepID=UPI003AB8E41F